MSAASSSSLAVRFWAKVLSAVVVILLVMVWEHVEAMRLERQIRPMRKEVDRLTYENARLQMQINQWMSPSHLEVVAKKQLSMGPIDPKHIIGIERPHD